MNQLPGLVASLLVFKQPMCRFSMVRTCSNIEKARTHRLFGFQMTKPHSVLDSSIVLLLQGIQRGSISQWDTHTHTRASHYVIEVDTVDRYIEEFYFLDIDLQSLHFKECKSVGVDIGTHCCLEAAQPDLCFCGV